MKPFALKSDYSPAGDQPLVINELTEAIRNNNKFLTLKGVTGSGKTYTLANLIQHTQLPTLIISHNKTLAGQLYQEFKELFPENAVEYFISYYDYYQPEAYVASKDMLFEKEYSINDEIDRHRSATIYSLLERRDVIVVASVSCLYKMSNPNLYKAMRIKLSKGSVYNRKDLINSLVNQHYYRNDDSLQRSCFRIRGDSAEVWPSYSKEAFRIGFEWGTIDYIWRINADTGEKIEETDELTIYPARNFLVSKNDTERALTSIQQELEQRVKEFKLNKQSAEAERLVSRTEYDIELIRNTGSCPGIENYAYHLSLGNKEARPTVLIDYFPEKFLTVIDESHMTIPQIKAMYKGNLVRKEKLVQYGFRMPSIMDNRPLTYEEFEKLLDTAVFSSATPSNFELNKSSVIAEQIIRPTGLLNPIVTVKPQKNQIEDLITEIKERVSKKERALVTTVTKKEAETITQQLLTYNLKAAYLHSEIEVMERMNILNALRSGQLDVVVGVNILREGLDLPEVSFIGILDADKQGFLRSSVSLIQTIGRASRNINGTVVMYANQITESMQAAMDENNNCRLIQEAYNIKNNITPQTITKKLITTIAKKEHDRENLEKLELSIIKSNYDIQDKQSRIRLIRVLEETFKNLAENMQFIEASLLKNEIEALKSIK